MSDDLNAVYAKALTHDLFLKELQVRGTEEYLCVCGPLQFYRKLKAANPTLGHPNQLRLTEIQHRVMLGAGPTRVTACAAALERWLEAERRGLV